MSTNTSQLKLVSNSLARLYRMQFLKRKRVKRICKQGEKTFNRGYKFNYCLTKQGWNHIKHLKSGPHRALSSIMKLMSDLALDPDINPLIMKYADSLPNSIKDLAPFYVIGMSPSVLRVKGRYQRFPPKAQIILLHRLEHVARELKTEKTKRLI